MLLFIRVWVWINRRSCISFNTSHVTLYRKSIYRNWNISFVSIHLMLLFINDRPPEITYWCWVSIHLMLLFIWMRGLMRFWDWCFNTSHVTLYQMVSLLKNIIVNSFNTSHVTLYQLSSVGKNQGLGRFNTSHVTLYQKAKRNIY